MTSISSAPIKFVALMSFCVCGLQLQTAQALPFVTYDARTAALGGVSVTGGARNSAYYNPALAATIEEDIDWVMMLPSAGQAISDPNDMDQNLDKFLDEAKKFENDNSQSNLESTTNALNKLKNSVYKKHEVITVMAAIPSVNFAGAAYMSYQTYHSAVSNVGEHNISATPPDYASNLEHKAVNIIEQGVALANYVEDPNYIFSDLKIGMTFKVMLFDTYSYTEKIQDASLDLDSSVRHKSGDLNFDIGLAKEFGVWKAGIVFKNLLKQETHYGNTTEVFVIEPQVRAGFAYRSRTTMLGIDLDLTENDGIVHYDNTQYAAFGWEVAIFSALRFRLGYKHNLVGDKLGIYSGGLGIMLGSMEINAAALQDEDGNAFFGDLSFRF